MNKICLSLASCGGEVVCSSTSKRVLPALLIGIIAGVGTALALHYLAHLSFTYTASGGAGALFGTSIVTYLALRVLFSCTKKEPTQDPPKSTPVKVLQGDNPFIYTPDRRRRSVMGKPTDAEPETGVVDLPSSSSHTPSISKEPTKSQWREQSLKTAIDCQGGDAPLWIEVTQRLMIFSAESRFNFLYGKDASISCLTFILPDHTLSEQFVKQCVILLKPHNEFLSLSLEEVANFSEPEKFAVQQRLQWMQNNPAIVDNYSADQEIESIFLHSSHYLMGEKFEDWSHDISPKILTLLKKPIPRELNLNWLKNLTQDELKDCIEQVPSGCYCFLQPQHVVKLVSEQTAETLLSTETLAERNFTEQVLSHLSADALKLLIPHLKPSQLRLLPPRYFAQSDFPWEVVLKERDLFLQLSELEVERTASFLNALPTNRLSDLCPYLLFDHVELLKTEHLDHLAWEFFKDTKDLGKRLRDLHNTKHFSLVGFPWEMMKPPHKKQFLAYDYKPDELSNLLQGLTVDPDIIHMAEAQFFSPFHISHFSSKQLSDPNFPWAPFLQMENIGEYLRDLNSVNIFDLVNFPWDQLTIPEIKKLLRPRTTTSGTDSVLKNMNLVQIKLFSKNIETIWLPYIQATILEDKEFPWAEFVAREDFREALEVLANKRIEVLAIPYIPWNMIEERDIITFFELRGWGDDNVKVRLQHMSLEGLCTLAKRKLLSERHFLLLKSEQQRALGYVVLT